MTQIKVAEQFHSVQGEGPYAGHPSVFLRMSGCNLTCGVKPDDLPSRNAPQEEYEKRQADDSDWVCDTLSTFRPDGSVYEISELIEVWEEKEWLHKVGRGDHIVLTGGEPTLPRNQKMFTEFFWKVEDIVGWPFVEVETNGTLPPDPIKQVVTHFNVSLKLSNSGMSSRRRLDDNVIEEYIQMGPPKHKHLKDSDTTAIFKFVVSGSDDVEEIQELMFEYGIPQNQIMLMPAGYSKESLQESYQVVAEICKEYGYRFSPRLHVDIWDQATGV